jgi:hypothetical protein
MERSVSIARWWPAIGSSSVGLPRKMPLLENVK